MTLFELYDTMGKMRAIETSMNEDQMRIALSTFKTHCATSGSQYEFNHFKNWVLKNTPHTFMYSNTQPIRVDM